MTANRKAELKAQLAKARHTRSAREAIDIVTKVLSEVISALDTTVLSDGEFPADARPSDE